MCAASSIRSSKVIEAFDRAGIELIGEGSASRGGGRGVRLKQAGTARNGADAGPARIDDPLQEPADGDR